LRDGFHLNTDLFDVRLVDDDDADVPPGTVGDVLISNLTNRAMVLLNYRIGDRGVLDPEPCPCGRSLPLLATLEGRRSELLRLADGREISSLSLESTFSDELEAALEAQFVQRGDGELVWRIVPFERVDLADLQAQVDEKAERVLGDGTRITLELAKSIPRTAQGKFMKVVHEPAAVL
jgi:phenylacetate-CoA ligase